MIEILKNEILSCDKYTNFVQDKIVLDNICLMFCYDNKCNIFLSNGMKIIVKQEVFNRIIQHQKEIVSVNKEDGFVKKAIKKIKGKE